jgi:hypothetical protein
VVHETNRYRGIARFRRLDRCCDGAPGSDATKNANAACTALKAKIGATAFTQAYATFGRCVSSLAPVERRT